MRIRIVLTLVGLAIAITGLVIYGQAQTDAGTIEQRRINNSAEAWADTLGYEYEGERDAWETEWDARVAEEDKTFGLVLLGVGVVVGGVPWLVRRS
ncbi:hypothetical protein [Streptomyces sp. NPDC003023]|uniref:hypothetical protein n=1 Tax=Streptomyces sp. NPDC003023 TaxID=3364675 RepID=UPI0036B25FA3